MVCSLDWQLMPSTVWPEALAAAVASGAALGTGMPFSGPGDPGDGAALSGPSVLRLASFSAGEPLLPLPPLTASAMPTAAAATTTTAADPPRHGRRRAPPASGPPLIHVCTIA